MAATKKGFNFLAPKAVEILLCRGSAKKIGTDSGKKLQKNKDKYRFLVPAPPGIAGHPPKRTIRSRD